MTMFWLLLGLGTWSALALLVARAVGRLIALDGRPPHRRPVPRLRHAAPFQRLASPLS